MNGQIPLYFAHANGFPSECYQELFDYLEKNFAVGYTSLFGHGAHPVTDNWPHLVDELIIQIKQRGVFPVVGVGHSFGGILIFLAACREPWLFQQIILLDAPLLGLWRSRLLQLAKYFSCMRYLTPTDRVRQRRMHFDSKEQALAYFQTKPLFQQFTEKSLALYLEFGLRKTDTGYILRFDREIEADIFKTFPHNLFRYQLPKGFKRSLIYCTDSRVMQYDLSIMQKMYGFTLHPFTQGSHLFPFEYPENTAQLIRKIVLYTQTT